VMPVGAIDVSDATAPHCAAEKFHQEHTTLRSLRGLIPM